MDYYTYANRAVTLKPLDVFASDAATGGRRIHGEVMVASLVTLFKKLKFGTDENVGWGPIDLPELELQTTAYWLTAEDASAGWRKDDLDVALLGAGRAIQAVAAVLLMVDPRDLGLVTQVRSPHSEAPTIYLYEAVPGGIGLSERLWQRHDELVLGARALIGRVAATPAARRARVPGSIRRSTGRPCRSGSWPRSRRRRPRCERPWRRRRFRHDRRGSRATVRQLQEWAGGAVDGPRAERPETVQHRRGAAGGRRRWRAGADRAGLVRPRRGAVDPAARGSRAAGGLPGQPPADAPLLCLDTETTGLATAAGTLAFLVGLGWWDGSRFRQLQLLLPDHADEPALLEELARHIPRDGWLVTYNGRGFDWPLLVARYRMAGSNRRSTRATWTCCRSCAASSGTG